jgi:DNA primase
MSDKPGWINFKELRTKLSMSDILKRFNVQLKVKGDRATGFCPLPTHHGQRKSPSFSADLVGGRWRCFGCGIGGNCLDLAARLLGFNPDEPKALRQAALKIRDIFQVESTVRPPEQSASPAVSSKKVLVNPPIDFELKSLDPDHPYLKERGFADATIQRFGLGFCNRGMLKGRVAIPIHSAEGHLVGYGGRITRDDLISETCPKYLMPGTRERDGVTLEFRKAKLLYNAHRIDGPVDHAYVVEGFPGCWWLDAAGFRSVVALMGSDCSEAQGNLIIDLVKPDGRVWILPDGNAPGVRCAKTVLEHVAPHRFCRWVKLQPNEQPTDIPADDLVTLLGY